MSWPWKVEGCKEPRSIGLIYTLILLIIRVCGVGKMEATMFDNK